MKLVDYYCLFLQKRSIRTVVVVEGGGRNNRRMRKPNNKRECEKLVVRGR
jgi:hypothetical protein